MGFFPPWRLLLMWKSKNFTFLSWVFSSVDLPSSSSPPPFSSLSLSLTTPCSALCPRHRQECILPSSPPSYYFSYCMPWHPWLLSSFYCVSSKQVSAHCYMFSLCSPSTACIWPISHLQPWYCEGKRSVLKSKTTPIHLYVSVATFGSRNAASSSPDVGFLVCW